LRKYGGSGLPPKEEDWKDWLDLRAFWSGHVLIVASKDTRQGVLDFQKVLDRLGPEFRAAGDPDHWRTVYEQHKDEIEEAIEKLLTRMEQA
jgi:hypothetical protein